MRDPERIDVICGLLATVWKEHPALRLGQLMVGLNIFPVTVILGRGVMIPFFQEDDVTESRLRERL